MHQRPPRSTPGSRIGRPLGVIAAVLLGLLVASPALAQSGGAGGDGVSANERYALCLKFYKRRLFTKALETCNRVRNFHRDDPVSVLAELAIADIYYQRGDREQARLAYEDFVRLHPRHEQVGYAIWRIGLCWWKVSPRWAGRDQTPTRQAVNVWTGYEARFPDSEYADEVEELLGKARDRLARKELSIASFYKGGAFFGTVRSWGAVRGRADGVIERYDDTPQLPYALHLSARAMHAWGEVESARARREELASVAPDSPWLARTDRALAKEPGEKPEEVIFLRPYKVPTVGSTMGMGAGAGAAAAGGMPGMGMR